MTVKIIDWKADFKRVLDEVRYKSYTFLLRFDDTRPYLQVEFVGVCSETKKEQMQYGRKWFLSPFMTKSEVVQTALKAVLTAEEHEAREHFLYRGKPIFGPHFNVDHLHELCQTVAPDARERRA